MTAIIAAAIGVAGLVVTTVVGVLAGPSRHLRRLETTSELLDKMQSPGEPSIAWLSISRARDIDSLRYLSKLEVAKYRRAMWANVVTALFLGIGPWMWVLLSDEDATLYEFTQVAAMLFSLAALYFLLNALDRLIDGVEERADEWYFELRDDIDNEPDYELMMYGLARQKRRTFKAKVGVQATSSSHSSATGSPSL